MSSPRNTAGIAGALKASQTSPLITVYEASSAGGRFYTLPVMQPRPTPMYDISQDNISYTSVITDDGEIIDDATWTALEKRFPGKGPATILRTHPAQELMSHAQYVAKCAKRKEEEEALEQQLSGLHGQSDYQWLATYPALRIKFENTLMLLPFRKSGEPQIESKQETISVSDSAPAKHDERECERNQSLALATFMAHLLQSGWLDKSSGKVKAEATVQSSEPPRSPRSPR